MTLYWVVSLKNRLNPLILLQNSAICNCLKKTHRDTKDNYKKLSVLPFNELYKLFFIFIEENQTLFKPEIR